MQRRAFLQLSAGLLLHPHLPASRPLPAAGLWFLTAEQRARIKRGAHSPVTVTEFKRQSFRDWLRSMFQ